MKVASARYAPGSGWADPLPALDSDATLVFAFGPTSAADDTALWRAVRSGFPRSIVTGCSTSGHVLGTGLHDDVVIVTAVQFEHTRVTTASASIGGADDACDIGAQLGAALASPDLRAVLVLSDGLRVNGSGLVEGLIAAVGSHVQVSGGMAGDGARFERTWVLDHGHPHEGKVVAVGLHGDALRIGAGSCGGWTGFGPQRVVTRADGNVLYELDEEPALGLYRRYLGDLADQLPASALLVPLAVRAPGAAEAVVRTILSIDETRASMTFAGDVPEGSTVQLMRASADRLIDGAATAASSSRAHFDDAQPTLSLAVSCVGRRLVLRERTDEELEAAIDELPPASALIGFYSYGEVASSGSGRAELHNQTMTITTMAEVAP